MFVKTQSIVQNFYCRWRIHWWALHFFFYWYVHNTSKLCENSVRRPKPLLLMTHSLMGITFLLLLACTLTIPFHMSKRPWYIYVNSVLWYRCEVESSNLSLFLWWFYCHIVNIYPRPYRYIATSASNKIETLLLHSFYFRKLFLEQNWGW